MNTNNHFIDIWTASALNSKTATVSWVWSKSDGTNAHGNTKHLPQTKLELIAVIEAIIAHPGKSILIHTNSRYVIKGATRWIRTWKRNNWKNRLKQPVKHQRLWEILDAALDLGKIRFQLVKRGSCDPMQSRVHQLAKIALFTPLPNKVAFTRQSKYIAPDKDSV